jgi:hypothetical protein
MSCRVVFSYLYVMNMTVGTEAVGAGVASRCEFRAIADC